eukprot:TRINITY_DN4965_c0_g1_i16.p1 TRINITY_DN4965_c0_g1~~TRINITY_DN4965_c0_g1_i16.p1  ORF type:complete len:138 (+),score=1.73 TRINITY_DN4965_c0_g1_i16:547-960(+)
MCRFWGSVPPSVPWTSLSCCDGIVDDARGQQHSSQSTVASLAMLLADATPCTGNGSCHAEMPLPPDLFICLPDVILSKMDNRRTRGDRSVRTFKNNSCWEFIEVSTVGMGTYNSSALWASVIRVAPLNSVVVLTLSS